MQRPHQYGWLFRVTVKVVKYGLLGLLGCGIACLVAAALGAFPLVDWLLRWMGVWLGRVLVLLICLVGTAVVSESLR